jgi:leucyl-tRNA synthetase
MPGQVLCLAATGDERAQAVAACLRRLAGGSQDVPSIDAVRPGLARLAAAGRLFISHTDDQGWLSYASSADAKRALFESASSDAWPSRIQKEMKQSTQHIAGAIFHLPLEDGAGQVDAFITDWSPFPAACAVAVHPQHPLAVPLDGERAAWTGRYARHPLTGDLLAIWTATWVRPEFGTGAVIVNPAHSAADLEFARSVGLPVRFALAPQASAPDPATWPDPPVIKNGIVVRSGIADGQDYLAARQTYLDLLSAAKFATDYTDHVLATIPLVSMQAGESPADVVAACSAAPQGMAADVLAGQAAPGVALVASLAMSAELVAMRAMHIDLYGADITDPQVVLVGGTAGMPDGGTSAERALALLAIGPADQTATVKAPNLEQAQRFFEIHASMSAAENAADLAASPARPAKRAASTYGLIKTGQFDRAFAELYKIQRDIRKNPDAVSAPDRHAYFALSYLVAGAPVPAGYATTDVISQLSAVPG